MKIFRRYPIVIHKDPDSDYGVIVPDLPGCYTWGDTVEDVLNQAVEAIKCHLGGMLIDGDAIPEPQDIAYHQNNPAYPEYAGGQWEEVTVAFPELRHYPVLITRKRRKHYQLSVPDLPSCTAHGKTVTEVHAKAALAIERHMEALVLKSTAIPKPNPIAQHRGNPAYSDGHWEVVPIIVPEIEHLRIARPGRIPRLCRWLGFTKLPWEKRPKPWIRGAQPPGGEDVNMQTKASELETAPQFAHTD